MDDNVEIKAKRVKLIVSDMDGTMLDLKREVSQGNREAIKKLKAQGILLSICTGRISTMIDYYVNTLEIEIPVITANGAVIWDPVKRKPLHEISMDEDEIQGILELCKFYQMDYCVLTLGTSYFSKNSIRINRFLDYNRIAVENGIAKMQLAYIDAEHECIKGLKIYKLLIFDTQQQRLKKIEEYMKGLRKIGYTSSEPNLLDVSDARVNKGYGIRKLSEILGLTSEEVCAIGDYENDIPMLDFAGFSVAMDNACEELKKHAHYITKSNVENGVAWVIEKYMLNE